MMKGASRSARLISQTRSGEDELKDGEGWSQGQGHQPPSCPTSFQFSHLRDAVGQTKRHSLRLLILHMPPSPLGLDAFLHVGRPWEALRS